MTDRGGENYRQTDSERKTERKREMDEDEMGEKTDGGRRNAEMREEDERGECCFPIG